MNSRTTGALCSCAAALAVSLAAARPARGAAFALQEWDAKGVGMANAFSATADDPAANFYNPAGITQLDGLQGSATLAVFDIHTSYHSTEGTGDNHIKEKPLLAPALYGTAEIPGLPLYIGLGGFVPYGLSLDWGKNWGGRYIVEDASIETNEYNLNVATKFQFSAGNVLALAAGGSLLTADIKIQRAIDQRFLGAQDAQAKILLGTEGNPDLRWNVAAFLSLFDRKLRLGFGYRDAIHSAHLEGRIEVYDAAINPLTGQPILPRAARARATGGTLPNEFRVGIAVDPIEPLTLEVDYRFTNWSVLKGLDVKFRGVQGEPHVSTLPFHFKDADFVAFGAEYRLVKDFIAIRAGAYWDESPMPLETISPTLPDNDRYGFSVGFGLKPIPAMSIDIAYFAVHVKRVQKHNDVGADAALGGTPRGEGSYETWANVFVLTGGLKF